MLPSSAVAREISDDEGLAATVEHARTVGSEVDPPSSQKMEYANETILHAALGFLALVVLYVVRISTLRLPESQITAVYVLLGLLGVASFYNFGNFRHFHDEAFINRWEQFHYGLGSKYFPELGFDGLYAASLAAEREPDLPRLSGEQPRDLRTNRPYRGAEKTEHVREVVGRFSPERWESFVRDHQAIVRSTPEDFLVRAHRDHGYNPTPAWTFVARGVDRLAGGRMLARALIDPLLLAGMFFVIVRTYGLRVACLSLAILGLGYGWRYIYVGAFIRLDWLAATTIGICMLEKRRPSLAGALFGYATLVRVFPVLFLAGPALVAIRSFVRKERLPWLFPLATGFGITLAAGLVAGSLTGRGPSAWLEFAENIQLHRTTWAKTRVGLESILVSEASFTEVQADAEPTLPATQRQVRSMFDRRQILGRSLQGSLLVLFAVAAWRASVAEAATLGMAAVFALTPIGSYYWAMLIAVPFLRDREGAMAVLFLATILYGVEVLYPGGELTFFRFTAMAWGLLIFFVVWLLPDALAALRRTPAAAPS